MRRATAPALTATALAVVLAAAGATAPAAAPEATAPAVRRVRGRCVTTWISAAPGPDGPDPGRRIDPVTARRRDRPDRRA